MRGAGGLTRAEVLGNGGILLEYQSKRGGGSTRFESAGTGRLSIGEAALALRTNPLRIYRRVRSGDVAAREDRGVLTVSVKEVLRLKRLWRGERGTD